jgi:hypothetical protein
MTNDDLRGLNSNGRVDRSTGADPTQRRSVPTAVAVTICVLLLAGGTGDAGDGPAGNPVGVGPHRFRAGRSVAV